ncbi:MAG: hypothetical protein QW404_00085 [Candidatus Nanoarchaeia archaeon]
MAQKANKKGTILLLMASLGFLIASIWLMQSQIKPKNIGEIEFNTIQLGNKAENNLFYIDRAAEHSLKKALDIKSRNYQSATKTYTNKEVCNLHIDACKDKKPDCETNLKIFCQDEVVNAFKQTFTKYLEILNTETGSNVEIADYKIEARVITSEMTEKIREIEIIAKTTKDIKTKEGEVEHSIKPNFKAKAKL